MRTVNEIIYKRMSELLPDVAIYPVVADDDARYPYVVYNADSFTVDSSKDGIEAFNFVYSVSVWSDKFEKCEEIADKLATGLCYTLDKGCFSMVSGGSSRWEGAYNQDLTFDVSYII